jgi:hypothetical protein
MDHHLARAVVQRFGDLPSQPKGVGALDLARVDEAEDVGVLETGGELDLAEKSVPPDRHALIGSLIAVRSVPASSRLRMG